VGGTSAGATGPASGGQTVRASPVSSRRCGASTVQRRHIDERTDDMPGTSEGRPLTGRVSSCCRRYVAGALMKTGDVRPSVRRQGPTASVRPLGRVAGAAHHPSSREPTVGGAQTDGERNVHLTDKSVLLARSQTAARADTDAVGVAVRLLETVVAPRSQLRFQIGMRVRRSPGWSMGRKRPRPYAPAQGIRKIDPTFRHCQR